MRRSWIPALLAAVLFPWTAVAQAVPTGGASGTLPADADAAEARLRESPRHGEWAMVPAGEGDSVRAWVVYPERSDPAPVVLVVHEIYGLTGWIRAVADQLAADGFIAIAPDLLTGRGVPSEPSGDPAREDAVREVRSLDAGQVHRRLRALAEWGMALPAAANRYGIVGFCWGGAVSFAHATRYADLGAAVVYYGSSPPAAALSGLAAPVLGLYGGDDARVNATIAPADSAVRALGRTFEAKIYPGAGHGFLRQQTGRDGANRRASEQAWPETVRWFRRHLARPRRPRWDAMTRPAEPVQVPRPDGTVAEARTPQELDSALRIRLRVFVEEQGISPGEDRDGLDAEAVHVLGWVGGTPVATGRVVLRGSHAVAGRIAVLPEHRGRGLGGAVVRALEAIAAQRGASSISLHPHGHLEPFYRALGYEVVAGTGQVGPHLLITMARPL